MVLVPKENDCLLRFIQMFLVLKLKLIVRVSYGSSLVFKKYFVGIVLSRV